MQGAQAITHNREGTSEIHQQWRCYLQIRPQVAAVRFADTCSLRAGARLSRPQPITRVHQEATGWPLVRP